MGRESLTKTTGNSWETTNNQEGRMIESAPILTSTKDERVVFPKYSIQVLQKTIETLKRDKDRDVEHNIYCEKLSPLNTDASQESGEDDVFKSSKDDKVTDNLLAQLQDLLAQTCPVSKEQTFPASELFERKRNDDQIDWQKKYNTDVCVLERKVEHANCVISELKSEVFNSRQDWYKIQGAKTGLETRLSEKDRQYSKLKKEYKQMENILEKTQTSLMEMHCSADKNSKSNSDLARKLAQKERYADHKKKQLHDLQRSYDDLMNKVMIYEKEREQKDELIRTYRKQLSDMYNRLIQAGVKEGEIYQMSSFRDPHGLPPSPSVSKGSTKDGSGDEAQMVQKALADLRLCFSECDPHVHSIETIDQCVQVLSEKIQKTQPDFSISQPDSRHKKESRKMKLPPSEGGIQPNRVTKILYYIPKSSTPFMAIIPKRVDQITLADFKAQIVEYVSNKKQRFLFKTIDPEFGTVKEEIDDDNCKLPGWEGKIIAWIEE